MKKITVFIEDNTKAEIKRQADAEGRSFASFLRRFLHNRFALSAPSPSVVAPLGSVFIKPRTLAMSDEAWESLSDEQRKVHVYTSATTTIDSSGETPIIVPVSSATPQA